MMRSAPGLRHSLIVSCVGLTLIACEVRHGSASTARDATTQQKQMMAAIEEELKAGHFAYAAEALTNILQTEPHAGPEVYKLLAFSDFKLQSNDDALTICKRGLALYPSSRPLAELYVSIVREALPTEDRQAKFAELSQQLPKSPVVLKAMGEGLMEKDPESAQGLALLRSAASLSPQDPEAHFFYGEAACFNKQDALCIRELTRAHALSPKNEYANMQIYTMIAVAEDRAKHREQAALAFTNALRANEQLPAPSPYAALKYINFLSAEGKDKEAAPVIDEVLKWDSGYGPAHFARAKTLAQQGATEDAAREAELALQDARSTATDLRTYHAFLAKTYFALGREPDARLHQDWVEAHQAADRPTSQAEP